MLPRRRLLRFLAATLARHRPLAPARRRLLMAGLFVLAFVVRALHAVDLAWEVRSQEQPGIRMMHRHDEVAAEILRGDGVLFVKPQDPSDTGLLARPPGYPAFLAALYLALGRTFYGVQLVQNLLSSAAVVVLFAWASRPLGWRAAALGAAMGALYHQYAHYTNLIVPDMICALPLFAALLLLARGGLGRGLSWRAAVLAGGLMGLGAWLRPNLVLVGCFVAAVLAVASPRQRLFAPRAAVVGLVSLLAVSPITVRNYLAYGRLVPMSINVGLVMWEGIGEASGGTLGPKHDLEAARLEAQLYNDPRYAVWWASPDGIARDRDRLRRCLAIIRERPLWFAGTVLRRATELVDYSWGDIALVAPQAPGGLEELTDPGRGRKVQRRFGTELAEELQPWLRPAAWLAPGRALWPLRLPLRALQAVLLALLLPSVAAGLALLAVASPRRALAVLALPLYYFVFQTPLHFEFRFALPMHGPLFALAGLAWAALFRAGAFGRR